MDQPILKKVLDWVNNPAIDLKSRKEIQALIDQHNDEELISRFYKPLEFGTAGIRGKMGAGLSRYNVYLVRQVSQGIADYLLQNSDSDRSLSIVIGYDNRLGSEKFAQEAASVYAANGIKVHIYPALRPTPMVSFAVRRLNASAGVMITASHNPPEYNGYKVFWSDGCQISSPQDEGMMACIKQVDDYAEVKQVSFESALEVGRVEVISDEVDQAYYAEVENIALGEAEANKSLHAVYTPLHGTGNIPVNLVLQRRGFENVRVVPEQAEPDGNFSTVNFPNPEEPSSFEYAIKTAGPEDTVLLATDPDSDRLGVMVRKGDKWLTLSGNQIGQLILDYYLEKLKQRDQLPVDGYVVSTIVTSELTRKIAESYGLSYKSTLTGFKNIGKVIREQEEKGNGTFVFGMEEANGYLVRDFVRDKDGVIAVMVFAEMAAELAAQGLTPLDQLDLMYQKYGYHEDSQVSIFLEGPTGTQRMENIMDSLRHTPPQTINGNSVSQIKDYGENRVFDVQSRSELGGTGVPKSNVLAFFMEDGSRITVRPSGTEPKLKLYFNLCGHSASDLVARGQAYKSVFNHLVQDI